MLQKRESIAQEIAQEIQQFENAVQGIQLRTRDTESDAEIVSRMNGGGVSRHNALIYPNAIIPYVSIFVSTGWWRDRLENAKEEFRQRPREDLRRN